MSIIGLILIIIVLIIIVSVILETIKQIEAQMLVRNYKGFLNS